MIKSDGYDRDRKEQITNGLLFSYHQLFFYSQNNSSNVLLSALHILMQRLIVGL